VGKVWRALELTVGCLAFASCAGTTATAPSVPGRIAGPAAVGPLKSAHAVRYRVIDLGVNFDPARGNDRKEVAGEVTAEVGSAQTQTAAIYRNGTLSTLPGLPQQQSSFALGLNDSGEIVGQIDLSPSDERAVIFHPGSAPTLLVSQSSYAVSQARAVNDRGTIVGWADPEPYLTQQCSEAVVFLGRDKVKILNSVANVAYAINDRGTIAAETGLCSPPTAPVLYDPSQSIPLPPGNSGGAPSDINAAGEVVGSYTCDAPSTCIDAVFYFDGSQTRAIMDPTGGGCLFAGGINDSAEIVGTICSQNSGAALLAPGPVTDLNGEIPSDAGWKLRSAADVNDAGVIVGFGTFEGSSHGFMLLPVKVSCVKPGSGAR
jgi:uncharacterized membrane protein